MTPSHAVDYDLAVRTAARLAPAGPQLTPEQAADVVTELRGLAVGAEEHVRAVTGLVPPGDPAPATVVDRRGWAQANVDGFQVVLEPLTRKVEEKPQNAVALKVTATLAGLQVGGVLSFLSSKVLGQYEAFTAEGRPGRLLLVAPNIVETERRLGVDPHDFRLWVALHEVTHRTQFTAVPWLHDHVRSPRSTRCCRPPRSTTRRRCSPASRTSSPACPAGCRSSSCCRRRSSGSCSSG